MAAYLARGFKSRGMRVTLIVVSSGGEVEELLTELAGEDIPIRFLGQSSGWRAWDLVRGLPRLAKALRQETPDVIISTANNTALISAFAMKTAGVSDTPLALKTTNPIVSSRHKGLVKWIRLWTYRLIFRWTNAVWTLSAEETEEMRVEFPGFASLFRHVDNPYVTPAMLARHEPPARQKTVVCIARLTAQKRIDRLIDAFAHVTHPSARLVILGEGEERAALERQISRLDLDRCVSLPGYVSDVGKVLHASDLFVLTSAYEGLPAAVLEAMAANCPVLSTDCFPSATSLVGGNDGCAIVAPDPMQIAAAIDRALERPRPLHLREVAGRYSIANGIASHEAALRDLLGVLPDQRTGR